MSSVLFQELKLGTLTLKNKIIMAPLTRARAGSSRVPNDLMAEYYRQRATAGLILTEATSVTPQGVGYADTPGIWSEAQVEGWKKITQAVHEADGKIFSQLWHVGRISDPMFLNGELPVSASAIKPNGHVSLVRPEKPYVTPRALNISEIKDLVLTFKKAGQNAKLAGFDGVELHAANGYLIDQFLQDGTNHRTDEYGGSISNRCRFLLEIIDALIEVWGADRVGVHLAPRRDSHDMSDSNPKELFSYLAQQLNQREIAFIFTREHLAEDSLMSVIRKNFKGILIANEKMTKESAEALIQNSEADAVAFGLMFIANPDLPRRFLENAPLNNVNRATLYSGGAVGYTDYPCL